METINSSHYSSYNAYDMSTVTPGCSFSTVHRIQTYTGSLLKYLTVHRPFFLVFLFMQPYVIQERVIWTWIVSHKKDTSSLLALHTQKSVAGIWSLYSRFVSSQHTTVNRLNRHALSLADVLWVCHALSGDVLWLLTQSWDVLSVDMQPLKAVVWNPLNAGVSRNQRGVGMVPWKEHTPLTNVVRYLKS